MTTDDIAIRILNEVHSKQGIARQAQMDIAVIILILKLIILAYSCFATNPGRAVIESKNPGLIQRAWIKHYVKKGLRQANSPLDVEDVYQAVLSVGKSITLEELKGVVGNLSL